MLKQFDWFPTHDGLPLEIPRAKKWRNIFVISHFLFNSVNEFINNLHLARKYAQIFVRGHYLFREANSFYESEARGKL